MKLEMLSEVFVIFLGVVLTHASVNAVSLDDRILQNGSTGTTVVLLSVAHLGQPAVFSNDNFFFFFFFFFYE